MAAMTETAALFSSRFWVLFIVLTVAAVVGSPATDLLEPVECLLRDCEVIFQKRVRVFHRGFQTREN